MKTSTPKISVIVPVYTSELYLKTCIDSILTQTFRDFECILVNDCSTDNSLQICGLYEKQDERIKIINKEKNEGLPLARKTGIENSSGGYIQFIDSDDWIEPDMLERMYNRALSENCDIVYCNMAAFSKERIYPFSIYDSRGKEKQEIINETIKNGAIASLCYKLIAKKLFNDLTFPVLQYAEDRVISVQLFLNANKIAYEYSILYHYLQNPNSLSNSGARRKKNAREYYENFILLNNILMKRPDYDLYRTSISNKLKEIKRIIIVRKQPFFLIKEIIKFLLPHGLFQIFWSKAG